MAGNLVSRSYPVATSGPQEPVNLDHLADGVTTVGVFLTGSATATYGIEFTADDVNDPDITPRWFPSTEIATGTTATKYAAISNPWQWLRVNFSVAVAVAPVELKVLSARNIYAI